MAWPNRPRVPANCAHLDLAVVERAIIQTRGDLHAAARTLNVPAKDLRLLALAKPSLNDAVHEQLDRALDKAMAVLIAGLDHPNPRQRIRAAGAILRFAQATRRGLSSSRRA
jgi:hypothetical protein